MPILDHLRAGNLFVVGDEKQSIYMFRDADLEVFDKTKREIVKSAEPGSSLNLPHSFRMFPQLVLFTNKLFGNLFANPQKEFNEVAPSDLICTKSDIEIGSVGILLADTNSGVDESGLVAKKILNLLKSDKTITLGDIAILCRKRKSFSEIETSLVKHNLPYLILGGKGFYQRQAIYDIYNYLTFLINPDDDLALVGALRSPFFNFSDAKLFRISMLNGKTIFDKLKKYCQAEVNTKFILDVINDNLKAAASFEPYLLIRKLLNESGYWSVLSSKKNSDQETANVEKLLAVSREFSNKGFKNLYDFTVSLKEFIKGYEDEGQAQVAENKNAIKLMTIHQSKGLEFKAVFIYGTNSKGREDNVKAKDLSISKEYGLLTKVPVDKKYFSKYSVAPIAAFYDYKIKRKNYAELKRLFYVAVTRAVKYLYISASHKDYKPVNGSFYNLLCDGLKNSLEGEKIYLAADTDFMSLENDVFVNKLNKVELEIAIEKEASAELPIEPVIETAVFQKKLRNGLIKSFPKH
ncbi:MAG: 3'-5' exonuclease, partial [Bacteroidota bacterium]